MSSHTAKNRPDPRPAAYAAALRDLARAARMQRDLTEQVQA